MKINKIYFVFLMGLLLPSILSAAVPSFEEDFSVSHTDSSIFEVVGLRYETYPVSPGEYFTIWIKVQKTGTERKSASFELLETYPFSLDSNEIALRDYGSVNNEPMVLEYKVRVADDAVVGQNILKLKANFGTSSYTTYEFDIMVSDVQTSFDAVVQEISEKEVSIALANIGQNDALATIVRIPEQDDVSISSVSGQMIGNLEQGDYTIVSFDLTGKSSALDLQVDYTDAIGERRSEVLSIPFKSADASRALLSEGVTPMKNGTLSKQQESESSFLVWVIVIVVLIIIAIFAKRWYNQKNKKKESSSNDWMKKNKSGRK